MAFTVAVDVVVVIWLLYRQRRVRRVRPHLGLRLALLFAVIGLIELLDYTDTHHLTLADAGVLTGSFVVAAIGLGALRALTVQIWQDGNVVYRQGTWWTVGLLLIAIGIHYGAEGGIDALGGPGGVGTASLLLWLGITYGVQRAVVHHRASSMLDAAAAVEGPTIVINGWRFGSRTGDPNPAARGGSRPGGSGRIGGLGRMGGLGGLGGLGRMGGLGGLGGLGGRQRGTEPPPNAHPDAIDVDAEPRDITRKPSEPHDG